MTRLAIVIVAYNAREELEASLSSLGAAPPGTPHDVIVVDNASTDGVVTMVRERFPVVRLLDAGANVGFARANNLGIQASRSELVLLLNPDTIVPAGAIDRLVARLDAAPAAVAAGPRLVDAAGRPELSFGAAYGPVAELRQKALLALREARPVRRYIDRLTSTERYVDWVSGACLLVRRAAAERAGLLDERYFMYAEDVDFCATLRAQGGRILFTPVAEVVHLRGRSGRADAAATRLAWERSHLSYYRKHRPGWARWLLWYLRVRGFRARDLEATTE